MQQVHAGFVGLGVGQGQEGRQLEAHRVSGVTSLQRTAIAAVRQIFKGF